MDLLAIFCRRGTRIHFLLEGFIIGISIAAPVGPIGLLCISRTLDEGRASGLVTGLGAATADAVYGCVAGFGLSVVSNFLIHQDAFIRFIGGCLLCYLGIRSMLAKAAGQQGAARSRGILWNYSSTFLLTITNPMTILSFAAVFAAIGVVSSNHSFSSSILTISGVFAGSTLWWIVLSFVIGMLRTKLNNIILRSIHTVSGFIILLFGIYGIWSSGIL